MKHYEDGEDPPNDWEYEEINDELWFARKNYERYFLVSPYPWDVDSIKFIIELSTEDPEGHGEDFDVSEMCKLMYACGDVLGVNYYE